MMPKGHDVSSPFNLIHARRAIQLYGTLDAEAARSLIKMLPFVYGKQVSAKVEISSIQANNLPNRHFFPMVNLRRC